MTEAWDAVMAVRDLVPLTPAQMAEADQVAATFQNNLRENLGLDARDSEVRRAFFAGLCTAAPLDLEIMSVIVTQLAHAWFPHEKPTPEPKEQS